MAALQGASVPLPKSTRSWVLFERMLFVPFCVFGLWRPLVGLTFIFSLMGLPTFGSPWRGSLSFHDMNALRD